MMMDGIEEALIGMVTGAAAATTAAAKYLPWWAVPFAGFAGGWLGMVTGALYGMR